MPESEIDLAKLFSTVVEALQGEKDSLNEADSYNHDHGDHMVQSFQIIAEALGQKQGASPAEQLAYASEKLGQSSNSGSARLYAQGLTRAANRLQGQQAITAENAMGLVQALLGGEGDVPLLQTEGRGKSSGESGLGSLITAGSTFVQAKQEGDSALEALMKAVMSGSQMNESSHQSQSGQVVGGTLIDTISAMFGGEKPKSKPKPKAKPKSKPKTAAKPKAKPKSESKPKTKPKTESKPKARPKAESKPKPKTAAKPKTATKPKAKPKTESKPKAKPKTAAKPKAKTRTEEVGAENADA